MIKTWLSSTSAASTDHTSKDGRMVPWREASRPKIDQSHLSTSKTHRPPTLEVRKAILETPAETDNRDSIWAVPADLHLTFSHVPRLEHGSYGVVQAPTLIDCATPAGDSSMGTWEVLSSTGLAKSSRTRGGQFQKSNLQGQSRPSTSLSGTTHGPLAQPIFPVVPRVETLSTLGPWNPGPGQERFCNLQKIKNMAPPAGSGGS